FQPSGSGAPYNLAEEGEDISSTSLALDNTFNNILFNGSSAASWTLPASVTYQTVKYTIKNRGSASITLSRTSTDVIYLNSISVTSVIINPGDLLIIFSTGGGNWAASITSAKLGNQADLTGQTGATTVVTYSAPGSGSFNTYRVGGYLTVTAISLDVIQLQVAYTDETNTSRTQNFFVQGATSGIGTTGANAYSPVDIRVKQGTTITVATVLTTGTGSITYDVGGNIIQLY
ncbi:MAG TPA: hypothetical protein VN922_11680, partial [Bacteroidia bacterium]|nr:hypothetical protein [Bacteroidia bacterium]